MTAVSEPAPGFMLAVPGDRDGLDPKVWGERACMNTYSTYKMLVMMCDLELSLPLLFI